ncbi:MAG TPA: flagellar motor protein MotB, partial [Thermodesulfobacteriota bacterium]
MLRLIYAFLMCFLTASNVFSQATIPSQDKKGSKDSPLLKRYEGSLIVYYEFKSFDEVRLPLSKLEPVEGKTDSHNNRYHEPIEKKTIEGAYTRLVYLLPENRSS